MFRIKKNEKNEEVKKRQIPFDKLTVQVLKITWITWRNSKDKRKIAHYFDQTSNWDLCKL